jgi:hypothetical protein
MFEDACIEALQGRIAELEESSKVSNLTIEQIAELRAWADTYQGRAVILAGHAAAALEAAKAEHTRLTERVEALERYLLAIRNPELPVDHSIAVTLGYEAGFKAASTGATPTAITPD